MFDLKSRISVVQAIAPTTVSDNTATASSVINLTGCNSLTFSIHLGTLADADATFAISLTHSDDNVTFTAVPSTLVNGDISFKFDDDNKVKLTSYLGGKLYCAMTITPSNNTGAASFSVTAIKGHLIHMSV